MKKHLLLSLLLLSSIAVFAEPYFVRVNGSTNYAATATGATDFQGRTQYAATCVPLQVGDQILCYDQGSGASWNIAAIDPYGAYQNFTSTSTTLTCNVAGDYNIYIKMKYQDDMWYIESASGCTTPPDPVDPGYGSSAPAQCPDVMLQGFYWNSYLPASTAGHSYGRTKWIDYKNNGNGAEIGQWFDLVWLPPCSKATGGTGYLPVCYSNLESDWGTEGNLRAVIDTLHENGCRVVADIVVNHVSGSNGWCTLSPLNFGVYGTFNPDMSWICTSDEAFTEGHCTTTGDRYEDGYDGSDNYEAGRDWYHQSADVRNMIKAYLKWMRYNVGIDGFRYDYCKGFHMSHVNEYNTAAQAYFSVLEYWDGNVNTLQSRLTDAGWNTLTFDFATKYTAFNNGIAAGNYTGCKGAGLPGAGKARYACTFVDSHDSFQRDDNELCGNGNSLANDANKAKVLQCNAYILSMPGVPCVFYPHWVTFKPEIKAMINARYKTGVHSESTVSDEAGSGYYKATITGTNGQIRLLLGPNSGYNTTPSGFTLAAKGTNWGVYYMTNSARQDKNLSRTPIEKAVDPQHTAIEDVETPHANVEKLFIDGQLYIRVDDVLYTAMGQRVK